MNTEEMEKPETLPVDGATKPQDTYRVFTYLEAHHGLLIACVSSVVAIVSALINIVAYIYQRILLQGWNIDFRIIDFSAKGYLYYYVLASLVFCVAVPLFSSLIQKIFTRYIWNSAFATHSKYELKKCKEECTSQNRQIVKRKRKIKKKKLPLPEEEKVKLETLHENVKSLKDRIKLARRTIWEFRIIIMKDMLLGLLAATILFLPVMFLYQIMVAKFTWSVFISSLLYSGIIMCIAYVRVRQNNKHITPKKIREKIDKEWTVNTKELDRLRLKLFEISAAPIPSWTTKQILSDQSLRRIAENLFSAFCSLCVAIVLTGLIESSFRTKCWIYTDGPQQYVVAYQDENQSILKEVEIDGNTLIVNLSRQKIVNNDGLLLESQKFSKIEKISNGD